MNENDRRTRRTQKLIRDNFIDLMAKKSINEITIQELADRADINRRTFYLHYTDIFDLLGKTEDYVMQHFSKMLKEFEVPANTDIIGSEFFKAVMAYIGENQKMLGVLCRNPDSQLMEKLIELTVNNGQQLIPFKNPENSEYILNYCCWGMVGIMHTAIRHDKFDITEFSQLADKLLTSTLAADGLYIK